MKMALLASVRNLAGRQHIAGFMRSGFNVNNTQIACVTMNKVSLEEQKEYWEKNEARLKRPVSPHLAIYRPQVTSMLSLLHRASGIALTLGMYGVGYAVVAMPYDFATIVEMIRALSIPGPLIYSVKLGASFMMVYHYVNGLRHMAWDMTYGFSLDKLYKSGYFTLGLSLLISAGIAAL